MSNLEIPEPQVVVIDDEYGPEVYKTGSVQVLIFEFRQYEDQMPDKIQLQDIKRKIDKVIQPDARRYLDQWYKDNYRNWEAIEKEEREIKEKLDLEQVERATAFLRSKGIKVE